MQTQHRHAHTYSCSCLTGHALEYTLMIYFRIRELEDLALLALLNLLMDAQSKYCYPACDFSVDK